MSSLLICLMSFMPDFACLLSLVILLVLLFDFMDLLFELRLLLLHLVKLLVTLGTSGLVICLLLGLSLRLSLSLRGFGLTSLGFCFSLSGFLVVARLLSFLCFLLRLFSVGFVTTTVFAIDLVEFFLHFRAFFLKFGIFSLLLFLNLLRSFGGLTIHGVLHGLADGCLLRIRSKLLGELLLHLLAQVTFQIHHFCMKSSVCFLLDLLKLSLALLKVALLLLQVLTDFIDVILALSHPSNSFSTTGLGRGITTMHALVKLRLKTRATA